MQRADLEALRGPSPDMVPLIPVFGALPPMTEQATKRDTLVLKRMLGNVGYLPN